MITEKLREEFSLGRPMKIFMNQTSLNNYSDEANAACGCRGIKMDFQGIRIEVDNDLKDKEIRIVR